MTTPKRIDAADFAVEVNPRKSVNDHITFDLLDTETGEGGRFTAVRQPDGRLMLSVENLGERTTLLVYQDEPLPFERWEVSPGKTIDDWRDLTTEQVVELAGSIEAAYDNFLADDHGQQNQMDEPWTGPIPPLGTISYDPISNDFAVLLRLDTRVCEPAEHEDGIKHHATYGQYVKWARFGLQPPPMAAWDHVDSQGELGRKIRTGGRRRTLAAQEAGRRGLFCWWSPTSESGLARWRLEDDDPRVVYYRERYGKARYESGNGQGDAQ
jgi:hypothetical protein